MKNEVAEKALPLKEKCELLTVPRSSFYGSRHKNEVRKESAENQSLMGQIDVIYTEKPCYGSRKVTAELNRNGFGVNRKRVQRLMRLMGIMGVAPGVMTSKACPEHKIYPYLLNGIEILRTNQVWSTDITYLRTSSGFMYLVAIVDWFSRKILSWRISNSMSVDFCREALEEAIYRYGTPEIFNSDQGSQFTSDEFTKVLASNSISISMDGRGRAYDNIFIERFWRTLKYEWLYMNSYDSIRELKAGLRSYIEFYNSKRIHQSLGYKTPDEVYWSKASIGGNPGGAALPVSSGDPLPAGAAGSFALCKI